MYVGIAVIQFPIKFLFYPTDAQLKYTKNVKIYIKINIIRWMK
jgi:hypothetical protein